MASLKGIRTSGQLPTSLIAPPHAELGLEHNPEFDNISPQCSTAAMTDKQVGDAAFGTAPGCPGETLVQKRNENFAEF